jgi:polysaccharide pyruvyl transferase CsaB
MSSIAPLPDCILIAGYYGFGNTGDEAILSAMLSELRTLTPEAHFIVLSGNPAETSARCNVEAFHANDPVARLDAIERSSLVIIGGGGLLHDYWGVPGGTLFAAGTWGMSLFVTIALFAALRRIPVMLWALGVGPLLSNDGRTAARTICRLAGIITVRDANSGRELEAIGIPKDRIRIAADPVFSTPPEPDVTPAVRDAIASVPAPRIGVCLRHWDATADPAVWEGRVAQALNQTATRIGASFIFIPFQSGEELRLDDVAAANRIRAAMHPDTRVNILPGSVTVGETWALIDNCDVVLGMRFHAGVAAATRAVPFVTLGYDPKVTSLMNELGLPDFNIDIRSVDADQLAGLLESAFAQRATLQQTLRDSCIRLGIRARQNLRAARTIMIDAAPLSPEAEFEPFGGMLAESIRNLVSLAAAPVPVLTPPQAEPIIVWEPLISVVLPVWNHKGFIATAIRSILAQTWRNLELIVVDDGSDEDLSPELADAIGDDPRAQVVRRSHEGLPLALNTGFRLARGDFFTWASADNLMHPEALTTMANFLLRHPGVAMVYSDMELIDAEGKPLTGSGYRVFSQRRGATSQLSLSREVETLGLEQDNFIGASFLYRAETARLTGEYDASRAGVEDYDYWLRMAASARIAHLDSDACLCSYRVHDNSISARQAPEIVRDVAGLLRDHMRRAEYFRQAFRVAVVVNPATPGTGRAATNFTEALRRLRHDVSELELLNGLDPVQAWAADFPEAKKIAVYFGSCPAAGPDVLSFQWLSPTCEPHSVPEVRMLRSSRRGGENGWPLLPATRARYEDLLLCLKARGTAYPMWDLPAYKRELFVYLGPHEESCIDWAAIESLVQANPDSTILFVSTDPDHRYDPRIRIPSAIYIGPRPPFHWYGYLSRADLLIAPLSSAPGVEDLAYDVLMSYLAAGKPILATPVIELIGFGDIPNARVTPAADFGEAAQSALRMNPDPDLASQYMESKSHVAFAKAVLAAANNELYGRLT